MKLVCLLVIFGFSAFGQTWLQLADFPGLHRDDGVAVNLNNQLYFGSGLTTGFALSKDFYRLDPLTDSWSAIAQLPDGEKRQYASAFSGTNCFFVFGGYGISDVLNSLLKYDQASDSWISMASKPGGGLAGSVCLEFGDKIIIAGGKATNGIANKEVWEYTISSDSWIQKNDLPFGGRFRASGAVINNNGYLLFGIDENNLLRREMFRYSLENDFWLKILDFPQPAGRAYAALKPIADKLILFGGIDSTYAYPKDVWYFDPFDGSWTQSSNFSGSGRRGGMAVVKDSRLYYSCGLDKTDTRLKETWVLEAPVGIKENKNQTISFSVYPNPTSGILNIRIQNSLNKDLRFTISDIYGRQIEIFVDERQQINLNHLNPGIYFLKLNTEKQFLGTLRVIKE